jgi:NhaP-type Na+/H+ or K+/H+ antiporter
MDTILIFLFVVATAVAIAVQRLAVPFTVALAFTGLVLGLLHAFEAPHLTKVLLFNVFLPGLLFDAAFHIEFKQFWRNRLTINSLALPGVVATIALTAMILTPVANGLHFVQDFTWKHALLFGAIKKFVGQSSGVSCAGTLLSPSPRLPGAVCADHDHRPDSRLTCHDPPLIMVAVT